MRRASVSPAGDNTDRTAVQVRIGRLFAGCDEAAGVEVEPRGPSSHAIALWEEYSSYCMESRSTHPEVEPPVMTVRLPRTHWNVEHPALAVRVVVAARTDDEARAIAWRQWYGPEPTTEFEELLRAAFSATDSGEPAK